MPASPLKIDGTAAETAVRAASLSNPDAVANLPTISGVKKRETADAMSVAMARNPFLAARGSAAKSDATARKAQSPMGEPGNIGDTPEFCCWKSG